MSLPTQNHSMILWASSEDLALSASDLHHGAKESFTSQLELDAAGRNKVVSTHLCRAPWQSVAFHPTVSCHILLHPWACTAPISQGTAAAGAAECGHPSCFALAMALAECLGPFCSAFAFYMHLSYLSVTDHCTSWLAYTWMEYKRASPQVVGKTFCEVDWLKIKRKLTLSFWESVSSPGHRKAEQGVALHN